MVGGWRSRWHGGGGGWCASRRARLRCVLGGRGRGLRLRPGLTLQQRGLRTARAASGSLCRGHLGWQRWRRSGGGSISLLSFAHGPRSVIGGVPYGGDRRLVASRTRGGPLVPGGLQGGRHGPPGLAVALIWTCLIECDGGPSPQLPATSPCPVPASWAPVLPKGAFWGGRSGIFPFASRRQR